MKQNAFYITAMILVAVILILIILSIWFPFEGDIKLVLTGILAVAMCVILAGINDMVKK